jgi:hypothetical protein
VPTSSSNEVPVASATPESHLATTSTRLRRPALSGHRDFTGPNLPPAETISQPFGARPLQPGLSYPNDSPRQRYGAGAGAPPRPSIPLPEPELLERQTAPDCEFNSTARVDDEVAFRAMKLDFEQQCYRQSVFIRRARMERLQDAVSKMIESMNR